MSVEAESDVAVKREWVAVADTTIKASPALANTLAAHEKMPIARGAHVTATITGEDQTYWTIADGVSGEAPLPEWLRFLYKGHWKLQPEAVTEAPAVEEAAPVPAVAIPDEPSTPVAEAAAEPIAVPPAPAPIWQTPARVAESLAEPASSKPVNHRRLFALFKRDAGKKRQETF